MLIFKNTSPARFLLISLFCLYLSACSTDETKENKNETASASQTTVHLLSLEQKWIEAEFALDTTYISTLLDSTFHSINTGHISNKQQEIDGIYKNMSAMRTDSIFLDSVKLEDARVKLYDNTAVTILIVHTYKKDKGKPTQKRTRFYDVWVNRNGNWKAAASQGTVVEEIK